jgi:hypothetical protein
MAYRPAPSGDDDVPSSSIFKALGEEGSQSFLGMSSSASPRQGTGGGSFIGNVGAGRHGAVEEENVPRSIRANGALKLREALEQQGKAKLPRGTTFDRRQKAAAQFDDDDNDDIDGCGGSRGSEEVGKRRQTPAQRAATISQLEDSRKSRKGEAGNASFKGAALQESLNARFKSTSKKPHTVDSASSSEPEDDAVVEKF